MSMCKLLVIISLTLMGLSNTVMSGDDESFKLEEFLSDTNARKGVIGGITKNALYVENTGAVIASLGGHHNTEDTKFSSVVLNNTLRNFSTKKWAIEGVLLVLNNEGNPNTVEEISSYYDYHYWKPFIDNQDKFQTAKNLKFLLEKSNHDVIKKFISWWNQVPESQQKYMGCTLGVASKLMDHFKRRGNSSDAIFKSIYGIVCDPNYKWTEELAKDFFNDQFSYSNRLSDKTLAQLTLGPSLNTLFRQVPISTTWNTATVVEIFNRYDTTNEALNEDLTEGIGHCMANKAITKDICISFFDAGNDAQLPRRILNVIINLTATNQGIDKFDVNVVKHYINLLATLMNTYLDVVDGYLAIVYVAKQANEKLWNVAEVDQIVSAIKTRINSGNITPEQVIPIFKTISSTSPKNFLNALDFGDTLGFKNTWNKLYTCGYTSVEEYVALDDASSLYLVFKELLKGDGVYCSYTNLEKLSKEEFPEELTEEDRLKIIKQCKTYVKSK